MSVQDYVALNLVPGIGPRLQQTILERYPDPARFFRAGSEEQSQLPGLGKKILQTLADHQFQDMARRELLECEQESISIITAAHQEYPALLRQISDPPAVLYSQGRILPSDQLAVAIVGSRNCTLYGRRMAEKFAGGLARAGVTIISGLARGIDAAAHRAALMAGGRTIAVCASGLKQIYPPEHDNLAIEISQQGAVISESPLHRKPSRGLFPQRNRIVSGMSLGVIVIEASETSGTLHTARHAMEQGRDVFALPGPLDSRESEGCHRLIRDGVTLVRGVDDVLQGLGPLMQPVSVPATQERMRKETVTEERPSSQNSIEPAERAIRIPRELNLTEQQTQILQCVNQEPTLIDDVIEKSGLEASRVLATITVLQMKKIVERLPGNRIALSNHIG